MPVDTAALRHACALITSLPPRRAPPRPAQSVLGGTSLLPPSLRNIPEPGGKPGAPLLLSAYNLPSGNVIDAKLLSGGVLFGTGWGLSGMCPGPAIVALGGSLGLSALTTLKHALTGMPVPEMPCLCFKAGTYVVGMLVGMLLETYVARALFSPQPPPAPPSPPSKAHAS